MTRWTLERSASATEDLLDIWNYIAADNPEAANRVIRELLGLFEKTADFPELGRAVDHLVPGYRVLTRGSYLLIYRIVPDRHVVQLARVAHSARNWPNLFNN